MELDRHRSQDYRKRSINLMKEMHNQRFLVKLYKKSIKRTWLILRLSLKQFQNKCKKKKWKLENYKNN